MSVITILAATTLPVTLDEAKAHLRVDHDDENDKIETELKASVEYVQTHTTLILAPTTLQCRLDDWPNCNEFTLPRGPVRDVTDFTYVDEDGIEQTVSTADYSWVLTDEGATITFGEDFDAPTLKSYRKGTVRVTFEAGFDDPAASGSGDDPNFKLPYLLRVAILMQLELIHEGSSLSKDQVIALEGVRDKALAQHRVYR